MRKEFNSQRIFWVHQHGHRFIFLEYQYGRRDVMWKRSITLVKVLLIWPLFRMVFKSWSATINAILQIVGPFFGHLLWGLQHTCGNLTQDKSVYLGSRCRGDRYFSFSDHGNHVKPDLQIVTYYLGSTPVQWRWPSWIENYSLIRSLINWGFWLTDHLPLPCVVLTTHLPLS